MPSQNEFPWPVSANEPVSLGERRVSLRIASKQANCSANVSLRMLPRPRLVFEGRISNPPFHRADLNNLADASVTIKPGSRKTGVIVTRAKWGETLLGETFDFAAVPQREIVELGKKTKVPLIQAAVLNFFDCYSKVREGVVRRQVLLEGGGWTVTIRAQPSVSKVLDGLNNDGGYGITHGLEVRRSDGTEFHVGSARDILEALTFFLSFARGAHCGPGLVRGVSANSASVWHEWGFPRTSRWSTTNNWFSSPQGQALQEVFPGFMIKWQSGWRHHLTSAIDMFAEANRDELDVKPSLILAQAALELLSWLVLVEHGRALSADGFRNLSAADQIRLLLHELCIPTALPQTLPELLKAGANAKLDGPVTLTQVRNSLVHPSKKPNRSLTVYVLGQAWALSMWYLELVLLHIFGYRGKYMNRLRAVAGIHPAIEVVPWASC